LLKADGTPVTLLSAWNPVISHWSLANDKGQRTTNN
jgi:hypothetical protein